MFQVNYFLTKKLTIFKGEETPKRRGSKGSSRRKQTVDEDDGLTIRRISTIACEKGRENEEMDDYEEIPEEEKRRGSDRRGSWDLKTLKINLMDLVEPQPKGKVEEPKRRSLWGTMMMQLGESGEEDNNSNNDEKLEECSETSSSDESGTEEDNDEEEEEKIISGISLYSTKGYFSDSERSQLKNLNHYM